MQSHQWHGQQQFLFDQIGENHAFFANQPRVQSPRQCLGLILIPHQRHVDMGGNGITHGLQAALTWQHQYGANLALDTPMPLIITIECQRYCYWLVQTFAVFLQARQVSNGKLAFNDATLIRIFARIEELWQLP